MSTDACTAPRSSERARLMKRLLILPTLLVLSACDRADQAAIVIATLDYHGEHRSTEYPFEAFDARILSFEEGTDAERWSPDVLERIRSRFGWATCNTWGERMDCTLSDSAHVLAASAPRRIDGAMEVVVSDRQRWGRFYEIVYAYELVESDSGWIVRNSSEIFTE